jgi:plasmid stabilization system protein ParE
MASQYYLSLTAEKDIEEIIAYIAKENINAAHAFLDAAYETMESLSINPHLGHLREDLTNKPVKFLSFKWHYLIVYKPIKPLEIVRVLSGYRNLMQLI